MDMKYFKLEQDKRIPYGVLLTGLEAIHGYYEYRKGNDTILEHSFTSFVNSSVVNFYPDILDRQIFIVKCVVKDVIDIFLPEVEYKFCCLIDEPNNIYEQYLIPMLYTVDIKTGIASGHHIFRNKETEGIEVIASLEFVEALLRRKPMGCRVVSI